MDKFLTMFCIGLAMCSRMCQADFGGKEASAAILPRPAHLEFRQGIFVFGPDVVIIAGPKEKDKAGQLVEMLAPAMGYELKITGENPGGKAIILRLDDGLSGLGTEGYRLSVEPQRIEIASCGQAGIFYGCQTLRQLLPAKIFSAGPVKDIAWSIRSVAIEDRPRFKWRGMHLDVSRHFFPKEFIERYIDLLALHKMNVFHWHLTDDGGWRIEIKKHPKLTEVGAWRDETLIGHISSRPWKFDGKRYGGFYTQQEVREIVAYAKRRHITVVPEIEMPGHCQAAIAAYPQLGNTGKQLPVLTYWSSGQDIFNVEESTIEFLQDVLTEVMDMFDSPFIHVGGDEVSKEYWQQSPAAQAKMKALGLKNENELQSWFTRRMDEFLTKNGRRLLGWDEILEGGLAAGATVMSWRAPAASGVVAARAGHDVVMAPNSHLYFDYYQADPHGEPLAISGFIPLEAVYGYEPVPSELDEQQARHILGAQGQVWTEFIATGRKVEYMAYPRAIALAEVVWTDGKEKDYDDFLERLIAHLRRLDLLDVSYCPLSKSGVLAPQISRDAAGEVSMRVRPSSAVIYYTIDGSEPTTASLVYEEPFASYKTAVIKAMAVFDGCTGEVVEASLGTMEK